jgi:hypothetical protein
VNNYFYSFISLGIPGAFWRAAFVASLAVIAFVLARYWKSLAGYPTRRRYLLTSLRGASLLLVACSLVGLTVEYESNPAVRVLIHRQVSTKSSDGAKEPGETEAVTRILTSLKRGNIEIVDQSEIIETSNSPQNVHGPSAAIFVTDGAMRSADATREVERASVAAGGGPVFVVTDFQSSENPEVALNGITVLNRPARGVPFTVRCLLHARGMRGRATLITISDDAQVRASGSVNWMTDDQRQTLTLELVPKTAGWMNYVVRAEAASGEDSAGLSRQFLIFAEERRQRILFLEGEPTWEAKFIRRALEKADLFDIDYFAQVSRAAVVGIKDEQAENNEPGSTQSSNGTNPDAKLRQALSSANRLNSYDCIVIGATPDGLLSNAESARIREWLDRRGGGLIVLGGNNFAGSIVGPKGKLGSLMPAEVDSSSFRSESQKLALTAPVVAEKSRGGFALTPTDAGQAGALRGYSNAIAGNEQISALSGEGLQLGQMRPGATVLAVRGQGEEQGTNGSGTPLIASMHYGAGRSIVFAPSDSWRMRTTENGDETDNDGPFASLWHGMALWSALGARPPVELVMSNDSPEEYVEVTAEIRVRDDFYGPLTIEKLSGRIQQLSETETSQASPSSVISFSPDSNDASIWRARFMAPSVGKYQLQVSYTSKGKSGEVEKYFATVAPSTIEESESRDTLQRAARETGGELFTSSNLNALNEALDSLPLGAQGQRHTIEFRSWWLLAFIIPLFLSCEWLILKTSARAEVR